MEKTEAPFAVVDFGEGGGRYEWQTFEDAKAWLEGQIAAWQWVSSENQSPAQNAWNRINNGLRGPLQNLHSAWQVRDNEAQFNDQVNCYKNSLIAFYKSNLLLLPNAAVRSFVEQVKAEQGPMQAAIILAHCMGLDLNGVPVGKVIDALLRLELFNRGIRDRVKNESAALKKLASDLNGAIVEHSEAQRNQASEFKSLKQEFDSQLAEQTRQHTEAQASRESAWAELLAKAEGDFNTLNETYNVHMTIAAPVEYWEKKRVKHRNWSIGTFIALLAAMLVIAVFLHTELSGVTLAAELSKMTPSGASSPSGQTNAASYMDLVGLTKIGKFLLLVTLAFWFTRILVRLFLSHIHLENDAGERVTMAKTYLALIKDGTFDGKENIGTVLAALFRPTGDGIVKDEGLPPSAMDWLTKLAGK